MNNAVFFMFWKEKRVISLYVTVRIKVENNYYFLPSIDTELLNFFIASSKIWLQ